MGLHKSKTKAFKSLSRQPEKDIFLILLTTMARIGATFGFAFALGLLFVSFEIVSSGPGAVSKREANAVQDYFEEKKNSILGGTCLSDDQCSVVSHCDFDSGIAGTCKLTWWFILALAVVGLFIVSSIVSCLCCPCCCLYNCFKSACDCLFCCCKSSKGNYRRP